MPSPQVKTEEEQAEEELEALQEAEEAAADQAPSAHDGVESVEDLGQQASATPEVDEELADPVPSGSDSFFDGTETVEDAVGEGDETAEPSDEFGEMSPEDMDEEHSFEEAINEGSARLAVVGLEDESEKDDLREEFEEVFEAFQLGHYGNRVMHDYFLHGADDVNPVWGLAGSAMLCTVMVVYLRPDGDEAVSKVKERLAALREGDSA